MRWLLAVVFVCLLAATATAADIKLLIYSDYMDPEVPKAFEKQTGIAVKIDVYEDTESMLAKLQTGGAAQYDVLVSTNNAIPILAKLKLIGKLDAAALPNAKNIDARFIKPPYDPEGAHSVPYAWGTVGIFYNKKKVGVGEISWVNAFIPARQPERVVLLDSMRDLLGGALQLNGAGVNSRDQAKLQQAAQTLIAAKNSAKCLGFDGSPAACKKVAGGQADLAVVYNGDALSAMKDAKNPDLEYAVPKEGSIIWVDTLVVTSKAPNPDGACKFINFLLDGKVGAQLSNYIHYASPNAKAMPDISPEAQKDSRIYPTAEQIKKLEYLEDVGKDTALYDEAWTSIKAK